MRLITPQRTAAVLAAASLLCVLGALPAGCRRSPTAESSAPNGAASANVLLIVADTTRRDRLGCYGGSRDLTPHADALATTGVRFDAAYAHAPWTLPSMASLLTSRHPLVHGAGGRIGKFTTLSANVGTLAEAFRDAGYRTGAVINVLFLSETFGLTRGFDHVDYYDSHGADNVDMRRATTTTDDALRWIESQRNTPFFALVHYFDPHLVYDPPEDFRRRFADQRDRQPSEPAFGTVRDMKRLRKGRLKLDEDRVRRLEKLYDGEVAYVDEQIGRLLDRLQAAGLYDNTIIVLTADHGEEFLDHGGFEHGHTLFEELIHVPLIFAGHDLPHGVVISDPVGLVDVAPTLCALADLAIPQEYAGRSLLPPMEGASLPPRPLLSQGNMWGPPLDALRLGPHKLIRFQGKPALFDLRADPEERHNLLDSQPALAHTLETDLDLLLQALQADSTGNSLPAQLTPEQRAQLCALGYLDCGD